MTILFKPCILIPVYNHEQPLPSIVQQLAAYGLPCILVDDGSQASCAKVIAKLAEQYSWVQSIRLDINAGKGKAVKTGILLARSQGFTHAVQIDADGQHDIADLDKFLAAARLAPTAIVTVGRYSMTPFLSYVITPVTSPISGYISILYRLASLIPCAAFAFIPFNPVRN